MVLVILEHVEMFFSCVQTLIFHFILVASDYLQVLPVQSVSYCCLDLQLATLDGTEMRQNQFEIFCFVGVSTFAVLD